MNSLLEAVQIAFGERSVWKIPRFHTAILKYRLLCRSESVGHHELCVTDSAAQLRVALVAAGLEQPIRKRIELHLVGPEVRLPYPVPYMLIGHASIDPIPRRSST